MLKKFSIFNFQFSKTIWLFAYLLICLFAYSVVPFSKAQQSVSVTVPPRISDFQFNVAADTTSSTFSQGQTITYTITYGASESAAFSSNLTLVAHFGNDLINGTHVVDYVMGSATKGYNQTSPVLDTLARSLTWNIPNLPAGTMDQTVSFQLQTTSNYTGTNSIPFIVTAEFSNQYVTLNPQSLSKIFEYTLPQSTITPTPTPITTPVPTPTPQVHITNVYLNTISDTNAMVSITTTNPTAISLSYGTSPTALSQTVSQSNSSDFAQFILPNLSPNTNWYLRATAINSNGKATSDIITFKTTATPNNPPPQLTTIVTSNGNVLTTNNQQTGYIQSVATTVLPENTSYEITVSIPSYHNIQSVEAVIRNKNTLGINTFTLPQESNIYTTAMIERQPGEYYATLPPTLPSGSYETFARISLTNGGLFEQAIAEIKVTGPLQVIEQNTHKPLEDARVFFFFAGPTGQFQPVTSLFANIKNPSFTDSAGLIHTVLPKGRYKIQVSAFSYESKEAVFTLDDTHSYPTVYLTAQPFNMVNYLRYYGNTTADFFQNLTDYVNTLSMSFRYFHVLAIVVVATSVFLAFMLFCFKTQTALTHLPLSLYHHFHHVVFPYQKTVVFGKVLSSAHIPVIKANVSLLDATTQQVLTQTTTNRLGMFTGKIPVGKSVVVEILKEGYPPTTFPYESNRTQNMNIFQFPDNASITSSIAKTGVRGIESILGLFFEGVLVLSLLLELAFFTHFGLNQTLPFFLLSLANILLWLFYTKESVRERLKR